MTQTMDTLLQSIVSERKVYETLLALSIDKKDVIIQGDVDALEAIVKKETEYLARIKPIEKMRENLVSSITKSQHLDKQDPLTLEEVASFATPATKEKLLQEKEDFSNIVYQLHENNLLNGKLIDTQLQLSHFMMNVMGQLAYSGGDTYSATGTMSEEGQDRVSMIDQSI